jgi:hypothetical protein
LIIISSVTRSTVDGRYRAGETGFITWEAGLLGSVEIKICIAACSAAGGRVGWLCFIFII